MFVEFDKFNLIDPRWLKDNNVYEGTDLKSEFAVYEILVEI